MQRASLSSEVCVSCGVWCVSSQESAWHPTGKARGDVGRLSSLALTANEQDCAEQLARFFPKARRLRIPVQVTSARGGRIRLREATVIEFGGSEHAIFLSTLPLEFDERVRLVETREGRPAEAIVVAVQYHDGRKAVAVKFLQGACDWVVTEP